MAKTDYRSIQKYHDVQPEEQRERMQAIRNIIHKVVPGVEETISYQIPCFKYHGYLIYYSGHTKHISLSYPYSGALLKKFEAELKNYKVSKSAIQFPDNAPLPLTLIEAIVAFRKKENESNKPKK